MCLAIYKPKGVQICRKYLLNGFNENDDGCGFALSTGHRIECFKGFKTFSEFWKTIKPLQQRYPMLIHFRWATHGDKKSAENMHPFLMDKNRYAVIHNGILNIKTEGEKSDTRIFCEFVLEPMLQKVGISNQALRYLVETSIGSSNKIVVMRADGKVTIYNESAGHWHKGAWYSNEGYKRERWGNLGCGQSGFGEYPWRNMALANTQHNGRTVTTYPKKTDEQIVFDEDEIESEAVAQHSLGIPDAESSNRMFPDYEGTSAHQQIIEG